MATLVSDAFNRANSTTGLGNADTGQTWSPDDDHFGIISNKAYVPGGTAYIIETIDCGAVDYEITATISVGSQGGAGLTIKFADTSNYCFFFLDASTPSAGELAFYQHVAGVETKIANVAFTTKNTTHTYRVTVSATGALAVFVDGSGTASLTATAPSGDPFRVATRCGLMAFVSGTFETGLSRWDDLTVVGTATSSPVGTESFGLWVKTPTHVESFYNGVRDKCFTHPANSGTALALAFGPHDAQVHVDRLQVRDAPGGTLLLDEPFPNLSAWTAGTNGADWWIYPAGFAYGRGDTASSAVIYRTEPGGAAYIELQGVTFDNPDLAADFWVMAVLHRVTGGGRTDGPFDDGYRVLLRRPGSTFNGDGTRLEVPSGSEVPCGGRWSVGSVLMA